MEDVGSGGFETKGVGLWIEAFGPERSVPWPAFVEAIEVRSFNGPGMVSKDRVTVWKSALADMIVIGSITPLPTII